MNVSASLIYINVLFALRNLSQFFLIQNYYKIICSFIFNFEPVMLEWPLYDIFKFFTPVLSGSMTSKDVWLHTEDYSILLYSI